MIFILKPSFRTGDQPVAIIISRMYLVPVVGSYVPWTSWSVRAAWRQRC